MNEVEFWKESEEQSAEVILDLTSKMIEYAEKGYTPVGIVTGLFRTGIITALATECEPNVLAGVFLSLLKESISIHKEARNEPRTSH